VKFPYFIAGLILLTAPAWFPGQVGVGIILLVAGVLAGTVAAIAAVEAQRKL
jgi:hypothetical protein